ncbi:MAG: polymorphic toxin type 15 domain-containing protein, partial [Fluviicola sp.]|nr:polymorphic toxin type 15 domain-containing protein [Fluviicola sp.]
ANLIGLGGLSKKVMKIFKKIRKRVDKAVNKLLAKAKKAARKIMRKLGIGSKEKPKNKEQHDEQVKAGLTYLKQQSTKVDDDNDKALTQIEAQKAANKTMSKFKVFKSITPIEKSGKWSFHWKASDGVLDTNLALEGNEGATNKIRIKRKTINFDKVTIDGTVLESKTSELRRQLGNQEKAINEMQVETWIERRNTFISNQTENDNNSTIRKRIKRDLRIAWLNLYEQRLLSKGFTQNKIEQLAVKFSNSLTDAEYFRILHNPDRVAGGKAKLEYQAGTIVVSQNDKVILSDVLRQLKVIGDNKVNGHIGGQWKTRVPLLHNHVLPIYNSASSENKPKLQMSVTLKIK